MSVNFVVGRNGAGKSEYLINLARDRSEKAIFICNTVHDKSPNLSRLKKFSAKKRGSRPNQVMSAVIKKFLLEGYSELHKIEMVLRHCGYLPKISITIRAAYEFDRMRELLKDSPRSYEAVRTAEDLFYGKNEISADIHFNESIDFHEIHQLMNFLSKEDYLKEWKLVTAAEFTLYKEDTGPIPLKNASSGELSLITSMMFLLSEVKETRLLLIDEPENSLHPSWQREYVPFLLDLISYYDMEIFIATHSPLLVTGAQLDQATNLRFIHPRRGEVVPPSTANIEELLWGQFEIMPPASRFLSEMLATKLDDLWSRKTTINDTLEFIENISEASFDETQKNFLSAAQNLAKKIDEDRANEP
ncbi:AAA family ATPase [Pseudomonas sp. EA_105y_Pfl2_R69]|uniref:AAA family ATPase n=1 Tax=Pseudomonas sp. EA_105y_Pfl2_R69 TaxID=3088683 RepID=UPI0030DB7AA3